MCACVRLQDDFHDEGVGLSRSVLHHRAGTLHTLIALAADETAVLVQVGGWVGVGGGVAGWQWLVVGGWGALD